MSDPVRVGRGALSSGWVWGWLLSGADFCEICRFWRLIKLGRKGLTGSGVIKKESET